VGEACGGSLLCGRDGDVFCFLGLCNNAVFSLVTRKQYDIMLFMKILSLNLAGRKDFGRSFSGRMLEIAQLLDREGADVICFQEATFFDNRSLGDDINVMMRSPYKYISFELAEQYMLHESPREAKSPNLRDELKKSGLVLTDGAVVMANFKITKSEKVVFDNAPVDSRGREDYHERIAQNVDFANGIKISNVHFASNDNAYLQLDALIKACRDDRIIVGDFNMTSESLAEHCRIWQNKYNESTDFFDYVSFSGDGVAYDHVLLPKKYRFASIRLVDGLSDHSALVCDIFEE
jgi:endonuclease/exonuclease/phosphatase family metal-dependent hydrolase